MDTIMIEVTIRKIDMFDDEEFKIDFVTRCDKCSITSGQEIKGPKMTRVLVTCSGCKDTKRIDIIPTVLDTVKNHWRYSQDDVDKVEQRLKGFVKDKKDI
jgi:RNase P subunit RPR2